MPETEETLTVIWSGQWRAWWRSDGRGRGAGYTHRIENAGVWPMAEARAMTSHCGPEKQIDIRPVILEEITRLVPKEIANG